MIKIQGIAVFRHDESHTLAHVISLELLLFYVKLDLDHHTVRHSQVRSALY
jgi:hypothetical protein